MVLVMVEVFCQSIVQLFCMVGSVSECELLVDWLGVLVVLVQGVLLVVGSYICLMLVVCVLVVISGGNVGDVLWVLQYVMYVVYFDVVVFVVFVLMLSNEGLIYFMSSFFLGMGCLFNEMVLVMVLYCFSMLDLGLFYLFGEGEMLLQCSEIGVS